MPIIVPAQSALKDLNPNIRLHFPSGPIRLNPHPSEPDEPHEYAWWRKDDDTGEYVGLEETLRFLGNYLDFHGPFDGVVGFSQGAALAALLSAALEGGRDKSVREGFGMVTEHPEFQFCVAISGFRPDSQAYDGFYYPSIETPVLNVLGTEDNVVGRERTERLIERCRDGEVVEHGRGHVVPRDEETVGSIVEFIGRYIPKEGEGEEAGVQSKL